MGWRNRLTMGLKSIGLIEIREPYIAQRQQPTNSLNVNQLKTSFAELLPPESYPGSVQSQGPTAPGLSQPVWGPEISTVGKYSREGYTSKTFDRPVIPFQLQVVALQTDEDVALAINHLASQVTGGEHYWKGANEQITEYIEDFSTRIDFDELDTKMVKELLWFGNSFWKPRRGVANIESKDDLMHIPISSAVRIWWDRQRIPYKYEFRGAEYQGYHNPDEIIHLKWNPINASAYGVGFGIAMTSPHVFQQITANGFEENLLPSLLDRKYSNQQTMHIAERRYTPRNVYVAKDADDDERAELQRQLQELRLGEDFVAGSALEVQELGSSARAFNPTQFTDTVLGPIMKALNDFRGKQGTESSHQFANAKTSALLDQIGLSSFPLTVSRMLIDQLFRPWYESNPLYDPSYGGGYVAIPWEDCDYDLNFGRIQKQDLDVKDQIELIKLATETGAVVNPVELRELLEDAGLGVREDYAKETDQYWNGAPPMEQDPALDPLYSDYAGIGGGPIPDNFTNQSMGYPPMNDPIYNDMIQNVRGPNPATENNPFVPNPYSAQPSDPRLNFTETARRNSAKYHNKRKYQ